MTRPFCSSSLTKSTLSSNRAVVIMSSKLPASSYIHVMATKYEFINGWMDGGMDGWVSGWVSGWVGGWVGVWG